MLDGLKMEENFQSAIETSASFSSLLGECSGRAPRAHSLSSTPQLWRPARWDTAVWVEWTDRACVRAWLTCFSRVHLFATLWPRDQTLVVLVTCIAGKFFAD